MLAMRNGQPFYRRETIVMLVFGSAGMFSSQTFPNCLAEPRLPRFFRELLRRSSLRQSCGYFLSFRILRRRILGQHVWKIYSRISFRSDGCGVGHHQPSLVVSCAYQDQFFRVLLQLPSGLSNGGGLLQFATQSASTTSSATDLTYSAGFTAAESLIETAIGLTVGLFVSAALVNLLGGGRRRGSNLSSF